MLEQHPLEVILGTEAGDGGAQHRALLAIVAGATPDPTGVVAAWAGFHRVVDAVAHTDAREHLRGGICAGVQVFAAHRDVFRALFSMAQLDTNAVGGAIARIEENRAGGMAHLAKRLAEQESLRPDVTTEEAADLLWLLASFDSFDQLYTGRNLAVDDVSRTLITTAERSLCR